MSLKVGFLAEGEAGDADDDGEDEDLQHVACRECGEWVRGDEVRDGVEDAGEFGGLNDFVAHLDDDAFAEAERFREKQAEEAREEGGRGEVEDGLAADAPCRRDAADAFDADDEGAEDERVNHHAQGVHVERRDEVDRGEHPLEAPRHDEPERDAEHEPDEYGGREPQALIFFFFVHDNAPFHSCYKSYIFSMLLFNIAIIKQNARECNSLW